ncbi:MAG: tail fiber domain-containing protein [Bacteroidota bacterium]|nr:tail fiber domain-containing protein [Bacteroidota bacterium]
MKIFLLALVLSLTSFSVFSQNVGIGNNNPQSKLHVSGAIRADTLIGVGVRNLFAAPNGRIYDSLVMPSTLNWEINGNANIGLTNFLGTLNANDLIFKTNNIEVARFKAAGNFGIGTANPNISALVEMVSTTSGLLIPRMTTAQRTTIAAPSNGLLVYDITINCLFFYNSVLAAWQSLCAPPLPPGTNDVSGTYPALTVVGLQTTPVAAVTPTNGQILQFNGTAWTPTSGTFWNLLGNAGTNAALNFLGTTDNIDLVFRTNNTERARILAGGNVGIATNAPTERLHVNGNIQLGNPLAATNVLGDKLYLSNTFNNTDDFWMARFNRLPDESEWRFNITDDAIAPATIDRIVFGRTTFPGNVWQPLVDILNDGRMGVGTTNPRGKFDVLNGDAYVADNVFPQYAFNVGRSNTTIFTDNIRPYTDNGFRIYDGNSPSHLHLESNTQGIIQSYNSTTSANPNALEIPGTEAILSLNPTGGGVRVGLPNGLSTCINPAVADNVIHKMTVGYGYFLAGNYNADPLGGQAPGTTWIGGVGAMAVGMNRNAGRSHVDFWNTSDVTQVAANTNADRGFEFRGYDNAYAERTMARIDGLGQFFSNGTFAISDRRFKTSITAFNQPVLEKLMQVKTYTYNMHQPVSKNGGAIEKGAVIKENDFGVLVQELYELFPGVVYKPKDDSKEAWSVDYSRFGLYLLQGMKEQQTIINEQKAEIKVLNEKYDELLKRISKLETK